jgi:hypothetical protein
MSPLERIAAMLSELRDKAYSSEAEVDARLIRPLLVALGWDVNQENTEVWIRLTEEMAQLWSYPSGQMRRDYVLPSKTEAVLHIEAKHRWRTPAHDIEALLEQISRDDWSATLKDGWQKDLALLLWGARSQRARDVRRAALIDDTRLLLFDWDGGWRLAVEVKLFEDPPHRVYAAVRLLEPAAFTTTR